MTRLIFRENRFASATHGVLHALLGRAGFEVRRPLAARRVQIMNGRGVDLVLDVGAAIGNYGRELRRFGYHEEIASFEPLSKPYKRLMDTTDGDPSWSAHAIALGNQPGFQFINVAANSDSSSLLPMLDACRAAAPESTYIDRETVRVDRLDDLWPGRFEQFRRPFLKLDAQGFEREVLEGARTVIPKLAGVQIELSFRPLYDGAMLHLEALQRLGADGFTLVGLEPGFVDRLTGELLQADAVFIRI